MISSAQKSDSPSGTCNILLVEDNSINQKVVMLMLGKYGIRPAVADNGDEAIKAVRNADFDLILMDLHMPGMGGIEATGKIRQILGERCPPIVALTADAVQGNETMVLEQGMNGFLTKPISSDTLRSCIKQQTGKDV